MHYLNDTQLIQFYVYWPQNISNRVMHEAYLTNNNCNGNKCKKEGKQQQQQQQHKLSRSSTLQKNAINTTKTLKIRATK